MSTSRRDFLKTLGGMALLTIVPRQVLGGPKFTAPSDQLTKGIIGVGGIGANTSKAPLRWDRRSSARRWKPTATSAA